MLVIFGALVLMVALDRFVALSRLGRGIRATAQDPETAALMGVNIDRVVMLTFLLGGMLAGAAGTLYGIFFEAARYNIGFLPGIKAFTAAVLGGIGNIRGALVGGFALGLLENYGATVLGGQWKDVFAFSVLVLVLMFRPTGSSASRWAGPGHDDRRPPGAARRAATAAAAHLGDRAGQPLVVPPVEGGADRGRPGRWPPSPSSIR